jgi:hypothetical protein
VQVLSSADERAAQCVFVFLFDCEDISVCVPVFILRLVLKCIEADCYTSALSSDHSCFADACVSMSTKKETSKARKRKEFSRLPCTAQVCEGSDPRSSVSRTQS